MPWGGYLLLMWKKDMGTMLMRIENKDIGEWSVDVHMLLALSKDV